MNRQPHSSRRSLARRATAILAGLLTSTAGSAASESLDFENQLLSDDIPVVLTAARLKQPRSEVPATVTVITGQQLQELGIRELHEVFRLVPGMTVGFVGSNYPSVSYHGTNANEQRRLQVLVDGRSVYNPNLANVDWLNIPVNLEDIERIEVTRGPNAAAYGANSFLAIVNVITKHPYDTHGARLKYREGSNGFENFYGAYGGGSTELDYRLSIGGKKSEGFDRRSNGTPFRDSYDLTTFALSTSYQIGIRDTLHTQLGQAKGINEAYPDPLQNTPPDVDSRDRYLSMKWNRDLDENHSFHLLAYGQDRRRLSDWRSCLHPIAFSSQLRQLFMSNPRYANFLLADSRLQARLVSGQPSGLGSPEEDTLALAILGEYQSLDQQYETTYGQAEICGTANADIEERRYEIEFQDTLRLNEQLRMVSGASFRKDSFESETYFDGKGGNHLTRVFANLEFRPHGTLLFNLGGMYERDQDNGTAFSPRGSAHYHIADNQTLRLVLSKAIRTPDTYEQSVNWSYMARELTPPYLGQTEAPVFYKTLSPGGLTNEQIISREIGYYLTMPRLGLEADIKWYHDSLYDLISAPLQLESFEPENNMQLTQEGIELELSVTPWFSDSFRLTYAYMDQDSEYSGSKAFVDGFNELRLFQLESRLSAQHSGSFLWMHRFNAGITTSIAYYLADQIGEFDFQRVDTQIAKTFRFGQFNGELSARLEHYLNKDPIMYRDNVLDDRNHFYLAADLRF